MKPRRDRRDFRERFEQLYEPEPNTGCYLWKGYGVYEYGLFSFPCADGVWRPARAHRVAWILETGKDPSPLHVLHRCDVGRCVNFAHLFLGDQRMNMADKGMKGRQAKGVQIVQHKLTPDQVREIRLALSFGEAQKSIAGRYGVDTSNISRINTGGSWRWLR